MTNRTIQNIGLAILATASLIVGALMLANPASADQSAKVYVCHAAGRAEAPANFVTLYVPATASGYPQGHFTEQGTQEAGHEEDYLGPCETSSPTPTPTPSVEPSPSDSPVPSSSPSPTPSVTPSDEPSPLPDPTTTPPTPSPSSLPTPTPSASPVPTVTPSQAAPTAPPTDTAGESAPASSTDDWTLLLAAIGAVALLYGLAETFNRAENR